MTEILIDLKQQTLRLTQNGQLLKQCLISSAKNGIGERKDSGCTPRGWHIIRAKIGSGLPLGSVFVGRRPTGEIYSEALSASAPERDWILTRILWLSGLEVGKNRLGEVDSMQRFIYIHGTPQSNPLGIPASKGCIRMHDHDLIELFDLSPCGTKVFIQE
jgi:L,D-transpeptidase YbiS